MTDTLMLIDGNSIVNRAFYALPTLNDRQGHNVNAVFGFTNILFKALNIYKPTKLIVAFDKHGHNFRKDIYPEYKATRKGMPEDLAEQMPVLHELLNKMQVVVIEKAGIEADDIIGTISKNFNGHVYVLSGDKDMLQLVSPMVSVLLTKRGVTEVEIVTPDSIYENYGLTASQIVDFKALRGDTSDNIPGVRGIGEKTATTLLQKYGTLDNLYAQLDGMKKGATKDNLASCKELAYVSQKLATIVTDADVEYSTDYCPLPQESVQVKQMLEDLQFKSIISKMNFDGIETHGEVSVQTEEITTLAALNDLVGRCLSSPLVAFHMDGETPYLALAEDKQYKVVTSDSFLDELTTAAALDTLKPLLSSPVPKAVYDVKSLRHLLKAYDSDICGVKYDVCIMQYLVEYRACKDVQSLSATYGFGTDYCAAVFYTANALMNKLQQLGLESLYFDVELPLADLLFRMECEGVKVDMTLLESMSTDLHKKCDVITEEIYSLAGERFNINSTKQLNRILFEKLALPHGKKTQRGYATDSEVLEFLSDMHPIAGKILEYRKVTKLLGTYVDGLKPLVKGGLVHTTFNQTLTSTGRLSSSDPNLQNIPIREDFGKEIRKLFLPKYGVFVGADYSQIELRLLAALSGDQNLLDCYRNGEDIHTKVASELLGIPSQIVTPDMRRMAKAVNFGIIYGISDFGLSHNTNISMAKAKKYIELYFERFPTIKSYLDGLVDFAKQNGYVETLSGRRRQIPEIKSGNHNVRNFGERAAMNMPLQGTAADIMKVAMLKVDSALKAGGLRSKIVLQVHDELIVDCYVEEAERVKKIVKEQMENAATLACPLVAETEEGNSLYEA